MLITLLVLCYFSFLTGFTKFLFLLHVSQMASRDFITSPQEHILPYYIMQSISTENTYLHIKESRSKLSDTSKNSAKLSQTIFAKTNNKFITLLEKKIGDKILKFTLFVVVY